MNSPSSLIATWIHTIVYFQVATVIGLAIFVVFLLLYRQWKTLRQKFHRDAYLDQVIEELVVRMQGDTAKTLRRPKWFELVKHESLRSTMLEQIASVVGIERDFLVERYRDLGLLNRDLAGCGSTRWWVRLAAITHLKSLSHVSLAKQFDKMKSDSNALVSASAVLALSELRHPLNEMREGDLKPLLADGRDSVIFEICLHWISVHGLEAVYEFSTKLTNARIRNLIVSAMASLRTPEAGFYLYQYLCDSTYAEGKFLSDLIECLGEIGDGDNTPAIVPYITHPEPMVRYKAYEAIFALGGELTDLQKVLLATDASPLVQRLKYHLSESEAA